MITVIVDEKNIVEENIYIDNSSDINHLKNVFRKNTGDLVRAVDGKNEYLCEIIKIESREVILKILSKNEDKYSYNIEINAGICLLKNDKMDLSIQKLTELGMSKIIPIVAKRNVVKLDKKKDKWDIIVRETLKQCQGVSFTVITDIVKLEEINFSTYDLVIVPYECEEELYLKEVIKNLYIKPQKILYIIGPEGGFEKEEIAYLKNNGADIVSLGKRILRAETAAIVTGGILVNEFQ